MKDFVIWLVVNGILLGLIVVILFIWRMRQPMTVTRLRREVQKIKRTPTPEPPCQNDFCRIRMLWVALHDSLSPVDTVTALLIDWYVKGWIALEYTPKKKWKSFGDSEQESLRFLSEQEPALTGAEKLFYTMLHKWTDDTSCLQQSELYQLAREQFELVRQRLEQFTVQGKHGLRSAGEMQPEKKRRHFGFLDEQRPIFTNRGIRQAQELMNYQIWLQAQQPLETSHWRNAVLLQASDGIEPHVQRIAQVLANQIIIGANAGKNSKS